MPPLRFIFTYNISFPIVFASFQIRVLEPMDVHDKASLGLLIRLLDITLTRMSGERFESLGITPAEMAVLRVVAEAPGVRASDVAGALLTKAPNITKSINRLEALGFLARKVSWEDERAMSIFLTPKGTRAVAFGQAAAREIQDKVLSGFGDAEQRDLINLLRAGLRNALAENEPAV
jgi:DNA-binding MarR family transcriptional regulator